MTDDEVRQALDDGLIDESKVPMSIKDPTRKEGQQTTGRQPRIIGAQRGITLDPQTQQLYEYETVIFYRFVSKQHDLCHHN